MRRRTGGLARGVAAAAAITAAAAALSGCGLSSREPRSVDGVLATYRAIDADAGSGNFTDLCKRYVDQALLHELAAEHKQCPPFMSEHWGESTPASRVSSDTRVALSGANAVVYDESPPEVVAYSGGQWRLTRIPPSGEHGTSFIRKLNRESEALNAAASARSPG